MEDYNYEAYRNHPEALPEELSGPWRLKNSMEKGGCGECQASCQSACKTSCTVANQSCANKENSDVLAGNEGKLNRLYNRK